MIQVLGRLAIIALLLYAAVAFWYGRTEKQWQALVSSEKEGVPVAAHKQKTATGGPPGRVDYNVILTRNIFKALLEPSGQVSGEEMTDLDSLAETSMQLVLLGTVSGSRDDARAIIREEKSKKEDIYQVGSELQGAIITRIERGRVVVQVNGKEEILNIKEPETGAARPSAPGAERFEQPPAAVENAAHAVQPDDNPDRGVPEALPRRRINFRNDTPPAPVEASPAKTEAEEQSENQEQPPPGPANPENSEKINEQPAQ